MPLMVVARDAERPNGTFGDAYFDMDKGLLHVWDTRTNQWELARRGGGASGGGGRVRYDAKSGAFGQLLVDTLADREHSAQAGRRMLGVAMQEHLQAEMTKAFPPPWPKVVVLWIQSMRGIFDGEDFYNFEVHFPDQKIEFNIPHYLLRHMMMMGLEFAQPVAWETVLVSLSMLITGHNKTTTPDDAKYRMLSALQVWQADYERRDGTIQRELAAIEAEGQKLLDAAAQRAAARQGQKSRSRRRHRKLPGDGVA